jgi:hypothetical protein
MPNDSKVTQKTQKYISLSYTFSAFLCFVIFVNFSVENGYKQTYS